MISFSRSTLGTPGQAMPAGCETPPERAGIPWVYLGLVVVTVAAIVIAHLQRPPRRPRHAPAVESTGER